MMSAASFQSGSVLDPAGPGVSALVEVASQFGTPAYAYQFDCVRARVDALRSAFGDLLGISYAVKANPNRALLARLAPLVDHLDVSSGGELLVAEDAGCDLGKCTFVGPGKADWEIELALELGCGLIVAESEAELVRTSALAAARRKTASVALRVNPEQLAKGFGVSMSKRPTPFGIDEEHIDSAVDLARSLEALELKGFHVYAGTQCLVEQSLAKNLTDTAAIFAGLAERHDLKPEAMIFGSGFGVPYHDKDTAINPEHIAREAAPALEALRESTMAPGGFMSLELGRYLIAEAGAYLTQVVHVKRTRGVEILILDGGMNHFLGASGNLGGVIKRNYPVHNLSHGDDGEQRGYDLAGPMCTNIDTLGRSVTLPVTQAGDLIAIGCGGAYGITASPMHFISHRPPREILITGAGEDASFEDISAAGTVVTPPRWDRLDRN